MKKVLFALLVTLFVFSCQSEPTMAPGEYQVNVNVKGIYNGMRGHLGLLDTRNRPVFLDTAMAVNEQLTFKGTIKSSSFRLLSINGVKGNLEFILEEGITNIEVYSDSIHTSKIEGGANNKANVLYTSEARSRFSDLKNLRNELRASRSVNNRKRFDSLTDAVNSKTNEYNSFIYEFIDANKSKDFALLLLDKSLQSREEDLDKLKNSYELLNDVISRNAGNRLIGQKIGTYILQQEAVANVNIGKVAPDFSAPTPDGKNLALNDIKGKATIIDFWASWCGPCRRENPNVVKVYEKYHDKGLEIISVSLDRPNQKDRWLQAIEKDGLDWHHVSNLQYWNDPIARLYNVKGIPAMFVLDANGKIVAKKLRGQALENQIASMLN
jgi:peroxiredoxin